MAGDKVWTMLGPYGGSAGALAIDPSNPDIAYTGTSGGVFQTINGGASWSPANYGLPPGFVAGSLAIDARNPGTVYAATVGGGVVAMTFPDESGRRPLRGQREE
jgi:hypothetical protein